MPASLFSLPPILAAPVYYLYLFLANFLWLVAAVTAPVLVIQAKQKRTWRWWAKAPLIVSLASVAGTLAAGILLAIPAFYFRPDLQTPDSSGRLAFAAAAGSLAGLFSMSLARMWESPGSKR
jgi:hypothetical protein